MSGTRHDRGVVLVTGAGRRIGRSIALDLASHGWAVAVHYSGSAAEADGVVADIRAGGGSALALRADLADAAAVERLIPQCAQGLGAPVCLINNAALFLDDRVGTLDAGQWDRQLAVNLRAPVFLAQSFAAHLPADRTGTIINIIDQRVLRPNPQFFSYTAAKAGLWAVTRTLAQALAPRIRVNAIGPGPTLANVLQSAADFSAEAGATLLERGTTPDEIAAAVRFLIEAPAMTGQMITLDGGQHLAWRSPDIADD